MEQDFVKYIHRFFKKLIDGYGFRIETELNKGRSYWIQYSSENFTIKIEKYFREFYVSLYKLIKPDFEINVFNLLEYLTRDGLSIPKPEYFRKETDIEECFKKQLTYLSSVIYDNYNLINDFFKDDYYEMKCS